jgi:hypothetical protein
MYVHRCPLVLQKMTPAPQSLQLLAMLVRGVLVGHTGCSADCGLMRSKMDALCPLGESHCLLGANLGATRQHGLGQHRKLPRCDAAYTVWHCKQAADASGNMRPLL